MVTGHLVFRHLRQVDPDVVIERKLATLACDRDRGRRELLRRRADPEDARRPDRRAELEVGHPVPAGVGERLVLDDPEGAPGRVVPVVLGEDRVDVVGQGPRECRLLGGERKGGKKDGVTEQP